MIEVRSNINEVLTGLVAKLQGLQDAKVLSEKIAVNMLPIIRTRIHVQGLKADGTAIGEYTSAYLRERQKKFNRTGDSKVILSATRQMENDFSVQPTDRGYGLGFNNDINYLKAMGNQEGVPPHTVQEHGRSTYLQSKVKVSNGLKQNKKGQLKQSHSYKKVEVKGEDKKVSSYQSPGRKGYGLIYALTESERQQAIEFAQKEILNELSEGNSR